jgi:hypothetical protein
MLDETPVLGRRIVGYNLVIECQTDPAAVRSILPAPLEIVTEGQVVVWWQRHHVFGAQPASEFSDPLMNSYAEVVIKVPCLLAGKPFNYTAMGWTDNDKLAEVGRSHGIPQRSGRVGVTAFSPADAAYDRPRKGLSLSAHMQAVGTSITSRVGLDASYSPGSETYAIVPNVGRRTVVDDVRKRTVIDDLYQGWAADYQMIDFWQGAAEVGVVANADSPIFPIASMTATTGYFFFSHFSGSKPDRDIPFNYLDTPEPGEES